MNKFLMLSVISLVLAGCLTPVINRFRRGRKKVRLINMLLCGMFFSAFFMYFPSCYEDAGGDLFRAVLLTIISATKIFGMSGDYELLTEFAPSSPAVLSAVYKTWAAVMCLLAPMLSVGFVLLLFKNLSAYLKYLCMRFKEAYIFSELNDRSLTLAEDIRKNHSRAAIVFTDVREDGGDMVERLDRIGAICFTRDIRRICFGRGKKGKNILFFTIGSSERENLNQALGLIESYRQRENTHLYVFSTMLESELLLAAVDKGRVKVRRVNEVKSLIDRLLYDRGEIIFESARPGKDGLKEISAVVVGLGERGREMVKALSWFGQMDGYRIRITAFDADPLAGEKFTALAPELMSEQYNGVMVEGEAQYTIKIYSGMDVQCAAFLKEIAKLEGATYVFVSLGDDERNIRTAVDLRMRFLRVGCHPIIQAVLSDSHQKKALEGIKNYRGQTYDIHFVGDVASSCMEKVIIDSELEEDALGRHLKWGQEEEFWAYEYNYRSSCASAIHMRARIKCGIPGADKPTEELSQAEQDAIEVLEHRRWNAYMRAEGYVYSGSPDKASRNDLAKMHHNLVDFSTLSEEDKRKDSKIGSK